ncbi:hypothetical protein ACLB2K_030171 [Fragaria x ananassa]
MFSTTDAKKFEEASKNGNLVPRYKCLFSDQLTPGRYSIVGAQPAMEIVAKENKVPALDHEGGCSLDQFVEQDPMAVPKRISENWSPQLIDELPNTLWIVNRPLAGAARRGKSLEEDKQMEVQLLQAEKQCA